MEHENAFYEAVGKRIREERTKKNMTQADLANKMEISLSHMSRIEQGRVNMQLGTFVKITEALDVSADQLLLTNPCEVRRIQNDAVAQILEGCTQRESEAMIKVLTDIKKMFIEQKK